MKKDASEVATVYVDDQEPWWGTFNPNLPAGDDVNGDGSFSRPFKTIDRGKRELAKGGIVRNLQSQLLAFTEDPQQRPPCDCGNKDASWHGDRCGLRQYMCDKCWKDANHENHEN